MSEARSVMSRVGQSWRDALRDVVLIVASIIIAFMLDAWWDNREDSRRANKHLAALEHEFAGILVNLQSDRADLTRAMVATRALIGEMGGRQPESFADSLSGLINSSYDVGIYLSQGGALSAILSSGDILLIRDDSLSYLLAQWPLVVEELRSDHAILVASREQELRMRNIALGIPESAVAMHLEGLNLPPTRFRFNPSTFLGDAGIESMLVSRLIRLRLLDERAKSAVHHVDRILERLSSR
jgi:hypothetical protein